MRVKFKLDSLYKILWLDAAGYVMDELDAAKPCLCHTVGWVKAIEKDHIVVASSIYDGETFGDFTVLPLGMIKEAKLIDETA